MAAGRAGASGRGSGASRVPDDAWPCPCGRERARVAFVRAVRSRASRRAGRPRSARGGHGLARPAARTPVRAPRSARSRPASRFEADRAALARYARPAAPTARAFALARPPGTSRHPGPAIPRPRRAARRAARSTGGGGGGGAGRAARRPHRPRETARTRRGRAAADAADPLPPRRRLSERKSPSPPPPPRVRRAASTWTRSPTSPPPDPDGERDPSVVGRWRGRCAEGHPVGFCGTCLLRDLSDVLCAAKRLEETVTDSAPRTSSSRRRRRRRRRRGRGRRSSSRPRSILFADALREVRRLARDVPLDEADADAHKQWSRAVSEAAFAGTPAARGRRARQRPRRRPSARSNRCSGEGRVARLRRARTDRAARRRRPRRPPAPAARPRPHATRTRGVALAPRARTPPP